MNRMNGMLEKKRKLAKAGEPTFKFDETHKVLMKKLMDCHKIVPSTMPKDIIASNDPEFEPFKTYTEGQIRYHLSALRLKETLEKNNNRPSLCKEKFSFNFELKKFSHCRNAVNTSSAQ